MEAIELNVVVFQELDLWVAQCLEHDISARAKTLSDLRKRLERTLAANLLVNRTLGRSGLDGIKPAPQQFHDLFAGSDLNLRSRRSRQPPAPLRIRDVRLAETAVAA